MNAYKHLRRQRGFTLIEALVALLIMAFGMLALAGMQLMLSRNAELARQRSEAVRLAGEQVEKMRSFTTIASTAGQLAWADLADGSGTVTTNTAYRISWTLAGGVADTQRGVQVLVQWSDRGGTAEEVRLNSVISRTDPADSAALGFPLPANSTLKRPKNRNLNIPIQARDLGDGRSVYQLADNFAVVFNNDSGYVVMRCDGLVGSAADLSSCTLYDAYVLAGYISGTPSGVTGLYLSDLRASGSLSYGGQDCVIGTATDQNSGAAIPNYKYYLCVIRVAATGTPWGGTVRLAGMATGTSYLVCRFQYPDAPGISQNQRNVQPYAAVKESLDQQNYYVSTGSSCPTVSGLLTVQHQNCRSNNAARATECPAQADAPPA